MDASLQDFPVTLAAWMHTLNPYIVKFTESFGLRWYGTAYAVGFVCAYLLLQFQRKRGMTPLSAQRLGDGLTALVLGVVVGGRLGYAIFYQPSLLVTFTDSAPWWALLRMNEGGMSFHGGMLGVVLGTWLVARGPKDAQGKRSQRVPWLHVLDLAAIACTPGLMLGRIANFINGELLGRIVAMPGEASPWWTVKFPQEVFSGQAPSAEQAMLVEPLVEPFRLAQEPTEAGYERMLAFIQSHQAGSAEVAAKLEPLLAARHASQLYQAAAEGIVLSAILWLVARKPHAAGRVGAAFAAGYGLLRIVTEYWRLPDAGLGRVMGLSRGQWLSVGMVLVALVLYRAVRRGPVFGGWSAAAKPANYDGSRQG